MSHFYALLHSPEAFFQKEAHLVTCRFICKQETENAFCISDLPTVSLQRCSRGAHRCRRQERDREHPGRAQQVLELIKCLSLADLQGGRG